MKSLQLHKPHLLVVVGLPGAGKSFFAKQFGETFNAPYFDYGYYRDMISDTHVAKEIAADTLAKLVRTRQTIVIERKGKRYSDRKQIINYAKKVDYEVLFIWVQTDPTIAEQRAVHSRNGNLSQDEFDKLVGEFELLKSVEPYLVISGKHTFASQAKNVLKRLVSTKSTLIRPPLSDSKPPTQTLQIPPRGPIVG